MLNVQGGIETSCPGHPHILQPLQHSAVDMTISWCIVALTNVALHVRQSYKGELVLCQQYDI